MWDNRISLVYRLNFLYMFYVNTLHKNRTLYNNTISLNVCTCIYIQKFMKPKKLPPKSLETFFMISSDFGIVLVWEILRNFLANIKQQHIKTSFIIFDSKSENSKFHFSGDLISKTFVKLKWVHLLTAASKYKYFRKYVTFFMFIHSNCSP